MINRKDELERQARDLQAETLASIERRDAARAHPQAWWLGLTDEEPRFHCEHPAAEHSEAYGCGVIVAGHWCPCYSSTGGGCG